MDCFGKGLGLRGNKMGVAMYPVSLPVEEGAGLF